MNIKKAKARIKTRRKTPAIVNPSCSVRVRMLANCMSPTASSIGDVVLDEGSVRFDMVIYSEMHMN